MTFVLVSGLDIGTMPKREISKVELEAALGENPEIRLSDLKAIFRCGSSTLARELTRHGLRTKPWSERKHSEKAKQKIRDHAPVRTGASNPNFGVKSRPWLEGTRHPFHQWHQAHPEFGPLQRGAANPIHQVRHLYDDHEYVTNITRGIRAHAQLRAGHSYEETYGEEKASAYKDKLRQASPARLRKFTRKETWIEALVREFLVELGVDFQSQVEFGPYTVDFFVPASKVVIQTDGDYWHANPSVYQPDQMTAHQQNRRRLDAACDSYLRNLGLQVLRLWEKDLKFDLPKCKSEIMELVK